MSKFIKKFEKFSSELNDKPEKTMYDVDSTDETDKDMTIEQFRKCHNYLMSGKWEKREDEKDFENRQKDLSKYKNLSDVEKDKYLTKLKVSDNTVLESLEIDFNCPDIADVSEFIEKDLDIDRMDYNIRKSENNITLYGFSNLKQSEKFKTELDNRKIRYTYQEALGSRFPYQIVVR